jgi:hypothetical protein
MPILNQDILICSFIKLYTAHALSLPIFLYKNQLHLQCLFYQTDSTAECGVLEAYTGVPRGGVWGVQTPPEIIPKF